MACLARAAEALLCPRSRDLSRGQRIARHVHLLLAQRDPRPAVLASRPDLVPQPADLPEALAPGADHSAVSLFSWAERVSISRKLRERLAAQRAVHRARQKEPDLPPPRSGGASASPVAAISAALAARIDQIRAGTERIDSEIGHAAARRQHYCGTFCADLRDRRR